MGNFLSGAQARLILIGGAWRAAALLNSDRRYPNGDLVLLSKESRHAR